MFSILYRIFGPAFHALLPAVLPILNCTVPGWNIEQRLGKYQHIAKQNGPLLWIHAASVGETQAARALIAVLVEKIPNSSFFFTATTRQGLESARARLPQTVRCELAPIDTPQAVTAALRAVRPDVYI